MKMLVRECYITMKNIYLETTYRIAFIVKKNYFRESFNLKMTVIQFRMNNIFVLFLHISN